MPFGLPSPDWSVEGPTWPCAEHSRFIEARHHRWHVQRWGQGPQVLLLHGTAASTHSFADVASKLAAGFEVILLDLPRHGFTRSAVSRAPTPGRVAQDILDLLHLEDMRPDIIVGHSAGSVVAVELARLSAPRRLVSINGAFEPFAGSAGLAASFLARALTFNPLAAIAFSQAARNQKRVQLLVEQTGSQLGADKVSYYQRLLRYPGHVSGALAMMASWELDGMRRKIEELGIAMDVLVGTGDEAVSPEVSASLAEAFSHVTLTRLEGLGHLAHEEDPRGIAAHIRAAAERAGVRPAPGQGPSA